MFTPTSGAMFSIILIIQYAVRKNIFACLFSVHNAIRLSRHEQGYVY